MQAEAFLAGEGDRYHERNKDKYAEMIERDPVLKVIEAANIRPTSVLEIGCATGFRLEELRKRYDADCHGIEPSEAAIREGRRLYPMVALYHGTLEAMYLSSESYDLIVLSFCLHWLDRDKVLSTLATVDRMLKTGGHLVISDFWPREPTKVAYKHQKGLFTYKAYYPVIMTATGDYRGTHNLFFNADTLEEGMTADDVQGSCALLEKGDFYRCV